MEQEYIQGFNSGYIISKYEPALSAKLHRTISARPGFLEGFANGREEYDQEQMQALRNRGRDREVDRGRA